MIIKQKKITIGGSKFSFKEGQKEIARAFLYILKNDLHKRPYGLLEDVFVDQSCRNRGLGTLLIKEIIKVAEKKHCYKLIATSRYRRLKAHKFYKKLGFKDWGKEFRIEFK